MRRKLSLIGIWIRDNAFWWLIMAGILALGLTQRSFFSIHPHWQLFLEELAFASIIASIFGLTVDKYQREEFKNLVERERGDLKRDIFAYAYGHTLHNQIRNEINERVFKCPFLREDLVIEWDFRPDDQNDHVTLEKRVSWRMTNNTKETQEYVFTFTQITASEKESLRQNEFRCLEFRPQNPDGEEEKQVFSLKEMNVLSTNDPHVRSITKQLELKAYQSAHVFYHVLERRPIFSDDTYAPSHPLVGTIKVQIRVADPLNLDVSASCKATPLPAQAGHLPPNRYTWALAEGLLPHQSIAFSWSPRKKKMLPVTTSGEASSRLTENIT
jgi:hypothetical protein